MYYDLAQIDIARLVAPLDDPKISEFVAQLEPSNALPDRTLGFAWRLQSESFWFSRHFLQPADEDVLV
ncbi:MAG TPA: DUF3291 domain-containing protein [Candidatus Acidoferrum sp.]